MRDKTLHYCSGLIINPQVNGKYIYPIYYPEESSRPEEIPQLTFDRILFENEEIEDNTNISSIQIYGIEQTEQPFEYNKDLDIIEQHRNPVTNNWIFECKGA
jgi:hypothetical protein